MSAQNKGRGAPKGTVNNPLGKNQWEGNKGKTIGVRLLIEHDEVVRDLAAAQNKTVSSVIQEMVAYCIDHDIQLDPVE